MSDEVQVITDYSAIQAITAGEIDVQIATAKKWPRDIEASIKGAIAVATMDDDTAEACIYTLKRREKGGGTKLIRGESVRMAEIIAQQWGNIRAAGRIVDVGEKFVVGQGVCIDLEKNVGISVEAPRRITGSDGRRYSDDMIVVTAAAAVSVGFRNAVLRCVGKAVIRRVRLAVEERLLGAGDREALNTSFANIMRHMERWNVTEDEALAAIGIMTKEQLTSDHILDLIGLGTAIKEGHATAAETFGRASAKVEEAVVDLDDVKGEPEPPRDHRNAPTTAEGATPVQHDEVLHGYPDAPEPQGVIAGNDAVAPEPVDEPRLVAQWEENLEELHRMAADDGSRTPQNDVALWLKVQKMKPEFLEGDRWSKILLPRAKRQWPAVAVASTEPTDAE